MGRNRAFFKICGQKKDVLLKKLVPFIQEWFIVKNIGQVFERNLRINVMSEKPETVAAETASALFCLERIDALAAAAYADSDAAAAAFEEIGALASRAKTHVNAYLKKTLDKELIDFDDGYPAEIDDKLDAVFDCAFAEKDGLWRQRMQRVETNASAAATLIAKLESETSMSLIG